MNNKSEMSRRAAQKLWQKFNTDRIFREEMLEKMRNRKVDMNHMHRISRLGVIARMKKHKKFVPDLTIKEILFHKARICACLAADGSVYIREENNRKRHYTIRFYPDNIELANSFVRSFHMIYGRSPSIKVEKKYFIINCDCKDAVLDLFSITKFGSLEWFIPFKILKNSATKKEWLKSFFDCDGYVAKKYVQLQSVNRKGIKQIQTLLQTFGIVSRIYIYKRKQKNWNTNYLLNIYGKEMMAKFSKEIGFNHPLKMKKLDNLIMLESPKQVGHQN